MRKERSKRGPAPCRQRRTPFSKEALPAPGAARGLLPPRCKLLRHAARRFSNAARQGVRVAVPESALVRVRRQPPAGMRATGACHAVRIVPSSTGAGQQGRPGWASEQPASSRAGVACQMRRSGGAVMASGGARPGAAGERVERERAGRSHVSRLTSRVPGRRRRRQQTACRAQGSPSFRTHRRSSTRLIGGVLSMRGWLVI